MGDVAKYIPAFAYGHKVYPWNMVVPSMPVEGGDVWFVDGDKSGDGGGKTWDDACNDIQAAVNAASAGDAIYIAARTITALATDPVSYAETVIIPNAKSNLSLIGVSRGRTQGGLPQVKIGAGSTAMLTVRAPGCLIANLGFNGVSSTGGGVLLDDDGGSTKVAFGTSIVNCHFKNCVVTTPDSRTGGAIMWSTNGGAWQVLIQGNRFYKNVGDVVLIGTSSSVPQDVVIEDNVFSGPAANVDSNIYTGGSGINGLIVRDNYFTAMPALSNGSVLRYVDLTGSVGLMADNYFASLTAATGSPVTFAADGTGGKVPTTVFMAGNWGETTTAGESGEIIRT